MKTNRLLPIAVFAALIMSSTGARSTERIATENFAALPDFRYVRLSPDGSRVAAIANIVRDEFKGKVLLQKELSTGERTLLMSLPDGDFKMNWIRWASNEKLLVSFRTRESQLGTPFTSTRMLVIDVDSKESASVISKAALHRADRLPQFQDRVVDLMPDDDEHILLQADLQGPNKHGVYRVNLNTGRLKIIRRGREGVYSWLTDRQHRVRVGIYEDGTTRRVYEQDVDGKNWRMLWEYEALSEDSVRPMGFAADPDILYISAYHEGRQAVFRVNLADPALQKELVFADDKLDVSGSLIYSPRSRDVVGIRTGIGGAYEFWSEEHKSLVDAVNRALPDYYNGIVSLSEDEQRLVFFSENDTDAGVYYLLDRSVMQMTAIAPRYNTLPPEAMAEKRAVQYEARDGTTIRAFLTTPKDTEAADLPTIVYPHGGPISFDSDRFDYWTQLFANRGYAVMQMNFRGSAGYGYDFMAAGFQSWGLQMQDDVTDATQWLIDNGIADPQRICIVGGSYGGYAALMGAATTPDLYRCAVSFAGVSDLAALLTTYRRYRNSDVTELQLGSRRRDLKARSPVSFAAEIDIPVLLIHGEHDVVVRVSQSRRMAKSLERNDKDVTYIEQAEGDHHLSTNEQRLEALLAIENFLAEHLN
ncbi:MAG: S9 family peptidase [Pseudomonadota bacterium]